MNRFREGKPFAELIQPVVELAEFSSSLLVGYAGGGELSRERLIPYFHVLSSTLSHHNLRVFVVGSQSCESVNVATLSLLRLIIAMEVRATLVEGIELTVFPAVVEEWAQPALQGAVSREFRRLNPHILINVSEVPEQRNSVLSIIHPSKAAVQRIREALLKVVAEGLVIKVYDDPEADGYPLELDLEVGSEGGSFQRSKELRNAMLMLLHVLRSV